MYKSLKGFESGTFRLLTFKILGTEKRLLYYLKTILNILISGEQPFGLPFGHAMVERGTWSTRSFEKR